MVSTSSLNAGVTAGQKVSECYFSPGSGALALGSVNAADAGEHSYFMNVSCSGRQLLGANAVGSGTLVSSSNDYRTVPSYTNYPAINNSNAASYVSATSDHDYMAGNNTACVENIDTTMSTSSTAVPQQYINLTAARTNARSTLNFPLTCDNVVVGTPTANSVTVTFDCTNGAQAGQKTTVNSNSNSGQPTVNVTATSMFLVGMPVEIGYGTARSEEGRIASISAGVSITLESNLIYTHTAADADTVVMQLRIDGLPLIKYGTASGVYSMSTALPDIDDWGLVWTGIKTTFKGKIYSWKRTGHSVTLSNLQPNTTYFFTASAYNPLKELCSSGEYSFTTAPITGASYAASSVC